MAKIGFTTSDGSDLGNLLVPRDIFSEGGLWLCGYNNNGQLGDNTRTNNSSPVQTIARGSNWKQVSSGRNHTAAIKTDGTLWTWGNNAGQLGDNSISSKSSPVQTISFGTNWKQVAAGATYTAAIKTDGTLWTWGTNTYGNLGDNSITGKSSPVQTMTFSNNWKQVACGYHTAAIKTDGTLWLWGRNDNGQLGNNTANNTSSPVQTIAFGVNWKQVSAGRYHTAAIKTDGTLWSWGQNTSGQLGDNTTTTKSSPVQTIAFGTNWKQVSCGDNTAAIKTDGTLWVWGTNLYGQLGDNTTTTKSSPVQTITFGTNWKQVAAGYLNTAAIKTDGTLWTWGDNSRGQLGDNTIAGKSSPVQTIAFGTNWKQVSTSVMGGYNTVIVKDDI
jgi:alpha-tubulin suppressor-like RCC1 family protein